MLEASRLVDAARRCLGTAFHHQGRSVSMGLDCIGLIVVALRSCGIDVEDRTDYGPRPDGVSLLAGIRANGGVRVSDRHAGDVLVFRYDNQPQHVALATSEKSMIHAFAPVGCVVEIDVGAYWERRLVAVYRFPFVR